jgi:hypothetical protein
MAGRVSRVRSEDDGSPASQLFSDLVGVDVVSVRGRKGARDCDELVEIGKSLYFIKLEMAED